MSHIHWKTAADKHTVERVSDDGRWHFSSKVEAGEQSSCYLSNFDVLCSPSGLGTDLAACFRNFIENCDNYVAKLAQIKAEAEELLRGLESKKSKSNPEGDRHHGK